MVVIYTSKSEQSALYKLSNGGISQISNPPDFNTTTYPTYQIYISCLNNLLLVIYQNTNKYYQYVYSSSSWTNIITDPKKTLYTLINESYCSSSGGYLGIMVNQFDNSTILSQFYTIGASTTITLGRLYGTNTINYIILTNRTNADNYKFEVFYFESKSLVEPGVKYSFIPYTKTKEDFSIPIQLNDINLTLEDFSIINNSIYYYFIIK